METVKTREREGERRDSQSPVQTRHVQRGVLVVQEGGEDVGALAADVVGLHGDPERVGDVGDLRTPGPVTQGVDTSQPQPPRQVVNSLIIFFILKEKNYSICKVPGRQPRSAWSG